MFAPYKTWTAFIDRDIRGSTRLMLKHGFIRHTVNKITFSEQCYYIFGDFKAAANSLPSELITSTSVETSGEDTWDPPGGQYVGVLRRGFSLAAHDFSRKAPPTQPPSTSSKSNSPSPAENKAAAARPQRGSRAVAVQDCVPDPDRTSSPLTTSPPHTTNCCHA
ncbi:Segment polarity protein dishevelled homolog DVL-1 [Geodia barretti]|uniref:Segment polarity protein dishevelled homolog DVL-1 n=1 Tax=Geodia barretti TaxID=519541 RepID=A0AA35X6N7_GEOBA|nr:Segment polarity protein dishevelled homolog DVL-1 [Geodia barretti]